MSTQPLLPELSKRELEIMKILWKMKAGSLREVHQVITKNSDIAYTTTKTVLDRMVSKGYLKRETVHGILVYSPKISKPSALASLVNNFMENVLEIGPNATANLFSDSSILTEKEIQELKKIIKNKGKG
jgi:BlaI family penicillinase repressor